MLRLMEEILHQLIGTLFHYLQGYVHPRWCRISSINSSKHLYIIYIYVLPEGLWVQADSEVRIDSLSQCRMIHVILDAL